jgi:DNA invertase Pin-like site-specific DNA recombinase
VFAEFEHAMIRERVRGGLARAREEGTKPGTQGPRQHKDRLIVSLVDPHANALTIARGACKRSPFAWVSPNYAATIALRTPNGRLPLKRFLHSCESLRG